jgi:putative glycosyltransferase (TIGR04372 family)
VLVLHKARVANAFLLDHWRPHLSVVTHRVLTGLLRHFLLFRALTVDLAPAASPMIGTADYPRVAAAWGGRPPVFRLDDAARRRGEAALRELGVPAGAWFVCVHARDSVYAPVDEHVHTYRNADIASYAQAVDEVIRRGGWCIRMGERGTASLPPRPGLVNYPDTPLKSDWLDVYLAASCRCFLGNSSGLSAIATIAGVPCALAHMMPLGACYGMHPRDLSIAKLARGADGRLLSFAEIFGSDVSVYRLTEQYRAAGITPVENTPEQVRELAVEMLDALDGRAAPAAADAARQARFRSLLAPRHYSYSAAGRIGSAFLREYEALLPAAPAPAAQAAAIAAT